MDPLSIVGLTLEAIRFGSLCYKTLSETKRIHGSNSALSENEKKKAEDYERMHQMLQSQLVSTTVPTNDEEENLQYLATRCCDISGRLLNLLKKTNSAKEIKFPLDLLLASKMPGLRKEMEVLEKEFSACEQRLQFCMNYALSSRIQKALRISIQQDERPGQKIYSLEQNLKLPQDGMTDFLSRDAQKQFSRLLRLPQDVKEEYAQHQILKALEFNGMRERFEVVEKAHVETFRWLLEDDPSGKGGDMSDTRARFSRWLSQEDEEGIFHIAGKLGSGKSTLMKFVFSHEHTKNMLQEWAGSRKLVLASFFFWRPGSRFQTSLAGLRRTLLYYTIRKCMEFVPCIFPERWNTMTRDSNHPPFDRNEFISDEEVDMAFTRLLSEPKIHATHRFCFFIDALDEHLGSHQQDAIVLADTLLEMISCSHGSLKICVSSREYHAFTHLSSDRNRLRLQDLTRRDMERYVRQRVSHIESPEKDRFVQEIVTKADGIFLWTAIVVKSLRHHYQSHNNLDDFGEELNCLPSELEDLFRHLLESIGISAKCKAYRLFSLVQKLPKFHPKLPLLSCIGLKYYDGNASISIKEENLARLETSLDEDKKREYHYGKVTEAKNLVQEWCKGLVEVRSECEGMNFVMFVHRSVPDFLQGSIDDVTIQTSGFSPEDALPWLLYFELRMTDAMFFSMLGWKDLMTIFIQLQPSTQDCTMYELLQRLDQEICKGDWENEPEVSESLPIIPMEEFCNVDWSILTEATSYGARNGVSTLPFMAFGGAGKYVKYCLKEGSSLRKGTLVAQWVLACLLYYITHGDFYYEIEDVIDCISILLGHVSTDIICEEWFRLLLKYQEYHQNTRKLLRSNAVGQTITRFLRSTAGSILTSTIFYGEPLPADSDGNELMATLKISGAKGKWECNYMAQQHCSCNVTSESFMDKMGHREVTVRDLIKVLKFENHEEIMDLMDSLEEKQSASTKHASGSDTSCKTSQEQSSQEDTNEVEAIEVSPANSLKEPNEAKLAASRPSTPPVHKNNADFFLQCRTQAIFALVAFVVGFILARVWNKYA